jgi:hypothetical protein
MFVRRRRAKRSVPGARNFVRSISCLTEMALALLFAHDAGWHCRVPRASVFSVRRQAGRTRIQERRKQPPGAEWFDAPLMSTS